MKTIEIKLGRNGNDTFVNFEGKSLNVGKVEEVTTKDPSSEIDVLTLGFVYNNPLEMERVFVNLNDIAYGSGAEGNYTGDSDDESEINSVYRMIFQELCRVIIE